MHRPTSKAIIEIGFIADCIKYTPLSMRDKNAAQAIDSMIKASQKFKKAETDSARLLAALWIYEAHLFFLRTLPESTASQFPNFWTRVEQISTLLGSRSEWEERCNMDFKSDYQPEAV